MTPHLPVQRILLLPAVLTVIGIVGLVVALLADGIWDMLGCVALIMPLVAGWVFFQKSRARGHFRS
jgi:hypothetical protein